MSTHRAQRFESQRMSEILGKTTTGEKQTFMSAWMDKILEDDFLCYDITSKG